MKKTSRYFESLYIRYNKRSLCNPDPLQFLYDYPAVREREIAALVAACFAYGNVRQIIKTVSCVLNAAGPSPRQFALSATPDKLARIFKGFKYRFTAEQEIISFWLAVKTILQKYGSLEDCFLAYSTPADETVLPALKGFAREIRLGRDLHSPVPDPDKKSALKRLNLFLRWMVRKDEVDPGGWAKISPAQLLVPLDVHMHRIAQKLDLTKRNAADITAVLEISAALKKYCPHDPIKYDFCLTRFGIRDDMSYDDL